MTMRLLRCGMVFVFLAACELLCAKDDPAMKKRAEDGWMVEDYAALEKIAAECRADRMDILDAFPRLTYFYTAIRGAGVQSDAAAAEWLRRLESWQKQFPESVTAQVALADFYVTDAWRAWDVGWSKDVKPEDWKLYKERLEKANEVLYRPGMKIEAEPSIAGLRVVVAMGLTPDDQPVMMAAVAEAQKHWPGWYPVYDNVARAMLPRWGGKLGESARFAETEANRISGAEGDGLYAMLAAMVLETEGVGEFPNSGFDMARFLRGLDVLASRGEDVYRHFPRQRAAYLEAKFGDAAKARERIFACGPNVIPLAYGDVSQVFPTWEKCGVMEELQKGVELEKAGKLREALAIYGVLSSENPNPGSPRSH